MTGPHAHLTRWASAPDQHTGYWGLPTASIDWCEINYEHAYYLAEFFNTVTNVFFIGLSAYAASKTRQQGLELRYTLTYVFVIVVGLGSFLFHATLKHGWQLADELPMLSVVSQNLFTVSETSRIPGQPKGGRLLPLACMLAFLVPSIIYYQYQNPIFHQVAYGTLLTLGVSRTIYLLQTGFDQTSQDRAQKRVCKNLLFTGVLHSALAFLVWNIDNWFCDALAPYKQQLGFPAKGLLEGHAIWHILCATGAVYLLSGCQLAALSYKHGTGRFRVRYTLGMPWIEDSAATSRKRE